MKSLKIAKQITPRNTESVTKYLQELSKLSRNGALTALEEVELAEKIKKGDKAAEEELVKRNLSFVVSVAKQYMTEGVGLNDLINEGNIGLIKAARKFDATRGFKFISYAVWWIRQSILCFINENLRAIRLPLNKIGQLGKIKKAQNKFEQANQRNPTTEELIDLLDFEITQEDLDKMFLIDKGCHSMNAEVSTNNPKAESSTFEDLMPDTEGKRPDEDLENNDLKQIIKKILGNMPENHKRVIELYYGLDGKEPMTLDEIGLRLDLTRERIRQIKKDAERRMGSRRNFNIVQPYFK